MGQQIPVSVIDRWSEWDRFPGSRPFHRPEVDDVLMGMDRQSLAVIRGCRGAGKSFVLKMVAARLAKRGWKRDSLLFLDLEDPVLAPRLGIRALEDLLGAVGPRKVVLLDGVERLPGWADWARLMRARTSMKVAAAWTGPVGGPQPAGIEAVDCLPLDLASWLKVFTDKPVGISEARQELGAFLKAGGLPMTCQAGDRRHALLELLFSSLMKDVILLQPIRDTNVLTAVSVYILSQTGLPISASRLKGFLTRSVDQARMFLSHLESAGLIHLVRRLEDSGRKASQAARLCFAADTGLAHALRIIEQGKTAGDHDGDSADSALCMTAVFHQLQRMRRRIWAWRAKGRQGLAVGSPRNPGLLIDVQAGRDTAYGLDPLAAAMERTGCESGLLLTMDENAATGPALAGPGSIETRHLWSWLLDPVLTDSEVDMPEKKSTDKKVYIDTEGLPSHLL